MKYLLFLMLLVPSLLFGQLKINPHVGLNAINDDVTFAGATLNGQVGLTVGVFARIGSKNKFFAVPGLQYYTYQHAVIDNTSPSPNDVGTATMQFLKVPLNVAYSLTGIGGTLKVYLQGGFTPSFAIGGADEIFNEVLPNIRQKDFILGGNIGLGIDVLFGTLWVNYEGAMTELFEAADTNTDVISIAVGIRL